MKQKQMRELAQLYPAFDLPMRAKGDLKWVFHQVNEWDFAYALKIKLSMFWPVESLHLSVLELANKLFNM